MKKDISTFSKKDFDIFKGECQKWIKIFGLHNWNVIFEQKQLQVGRFAEMSTNSGAMSAIISLTIETRYGKGDIKNHARHEVSHLLLGKLSDLAVSKFTTSDEIYKVEEEITNILAKVLKNYLICDKK